LAGAAAYLELDELVQVPNLDAIDIALPTALHAGTAIKALAAGKHVICEKPMALSLADCRRMTSAAKQAGRMLLVAHVLPFFPEYAWALKVVRSGKYGPVRDAWFKRMTCDPTWIENYWSPEAVGGPMFDLHVHDAHFVRLLFGKPTSVNAKGRIRNGLPEFWGWSVRFPVPGSHVHGLSGVRHQSGLTFNHGFIIALEAATLRFDFVVVNAKERYLVAPTIEDYRSGTTRTRRPKLRGGDPLDAFTAELREAIRSIRTGRPSEILSAELAQDAIRICQAETKSLLGGRTVRV
jgi:predicted dehydrogenase